MKRPGVLSILKTMSSPRVGELAMNIDGVFNIPQNEEDCLKSLQWFGNQRVLPLIVTDALSIQPGETFIIEGENKIFTCKAVNIHKRLIQSEFSSEDNSVIHVSMSRAKKIVGYYTNISQLIQGTVKDGDTLMLVQTQ